MAKPEENRTAAAGDTHNFDTMHLMSDNIKVKLTKPLPLDMEKLGSIKMLNVDCEPLKKKKAYNRRQSVSFYANNLRVVCNAVLRCRTTGQHELFIQTPLLEKVDYV